MDRKGLDPGAQSQIEADCGETGIATPPPCLADMPDQEIVIWTPLRMAKAFFRALAAPVYLTRLASRTDDAA